MRSCADGAALLAAAVLAAAVLACSVASPETEVRQSLARLGHAGFAGGAHVRLERATFADVTVSMDGGRARVVAMVEASGRARDVALAYVGREAFAMEPCPAARWCLAEGTLPALEAVVAALEQAPRSPRARVVAWQVRVERDAATVGEDYELDGRRLRARWEVGRRGEGWRVVAPP